jgi:hypothetical protein
MEEFFERRRKSNAATLRASNGVDRQRFVSRLRHSKGHPCPGVHSTTKVFVWDTFPPYEPMLYRCRISKAAREDVFTSFNDKTRRYDPITDSWDCYKGWSEDTRDDDTMEEIELYGEDPLFASVMSTSLASPLDSTPQHSAGSPQSSQRTSLPSLPPAVPSPTYSSTEASASLRLDPQPVAQEDEGMPGQKTELSATAMFVDPPALEPLPSSPRHHASAPDNLMMTIHRPSQEAFASSPQRDGTVTDSPPPNLMRVNGEFFHSALIFRYGFHGFDLRPQDFQFSKKALANDPKKIRDLRRAYLAERENLPIAYYKPLMDFTDILISNRQKELHKIPGSPVPLSGFWDLGPHSPRRLPLPTPSTEQSLSAFIKVRPLRCSKTRRVVYFLKMVESSDVRFHVVVNHAATAIECYRRGWRTSLEVLRHLTEVGKPFGTFVPRLQEFTGPAITRACRVLGWRRNGYVFRPEDFAEYEDLRLTFLETQPHARAGGQEGGIVWRLTVDDIGLAAVLRGPSPSAHATGNIFTAPNGAEFVNDRLTEEEMDMLCGKYQVYTGSSIIFSP